MYEGSETAFLNAILSAHGYDLYVNNSAEILAELCQNDPEYFLDVCEELVKIMIQVFFRPASDIQPGILKMIADDLGNILGPLWALQAYHQLVKYIIKAQNMASYADREKNARKKIKFMEDCFDALDNAHKFLGGIRRNRT